MVAAVVSQRVGFGRELIERALPYSSGVETSYESGSGRLRCTIIVPVSANAEELPSDPIGRGSTRAPNSTSGTRGAWIGSGNGTQRARPMSHDHLCFIVLGSRLRLSLVKAVPGGNGAHDPSSSAAQGGKPPCRRPSSSRVAAELDRGPERVWKDHHWSGHAAASSRPQAVKPPRLVTSPSGDHRPHGATIPSSPFSTAVHSADATRLGEVGRRGPDALRPACPVLVRARDAPTFRRRRPCRALGRQERRG